VRRWVASKLSFAKMCAALLTVTLATSREVIAPMISPFGRPVVPSGACV
jgi:hypothetical protein